MSDKNPTTKDPRCGTLAGYRRHHRANEKPCKDCRMARAKWTKHRRDQGKAS